MIHARLEQLYEADQADRRDDVDDVQAMMRRDADRRAEVYRIIGDPGSLTALDLFRAAMILQHGDSPADIARAYELARSSDLAGHRPARRLVAMTEDRLLMYQGHRQRYGTQMVSDGIRWRLWDVDEQTTDAERAAVDVAPLAELEASVGELTAGLPNSPDDVVAPWLLEARLRWRSQE